ncbi:hypothetical protein AB3331_02685, partial [Streptococcus sp. H49]
KLAKNLPSKTSNTQKPHSDSFILIVFKTEITVWFYFETSFCPGSFFYILLIEKQSFFLVLFTGAIGLSAPSKPHGKLGRQLHFLFCYRRLL